MMRWSSSSRLTEASCSPKKNWRLLSPLSSQPGSFTFLIAWIKTIVKRKFPRKKLLIRRKILHNTKIWNILCYSSELTSYLALSPHIYHWTCSPGKTSPGTNKLSTGSCIVLVCWYQFGELQGRVEYERRCPDDPEDGADLQWERLDRSYSSSLQFIQNWLEPRPGIRT